VYLEEAIAQCAEAIVELSGDPLTQSTSLKRREIRQSHVVGLDHGVGLNHSVQRADDQPPVTARLSVGAPPAEQLSPVEILRGPSACLLAGDAADEEGGGPEFVIGRRRHGRDSWGFG
jgi:hypothetical protein